jgi:hypothetical protein
MVIRQTFIFFFLFWLALQQKKKIKDGELFFLKKINLIVIVKK